MSQQQARAFMEYAQGDEATARRVAALKGRTALQELVAIAGEHGFAFTEEEYRAAVVEAAEGELSDEAIRKTQREMGM
jgi:predicted ribosomally synthesized peptide with nif11-like leader